MIHINLKPYRAARKKENVRQQVIVFLLLMVFTVLGLYWYNDRLDKKIEALETQITLTEKEVARYNKIAKEVEELKQKLAILKMKLEVIENLDMNRGEAYRLLESLTTLVIEKKMWFTRLEAMEEQVRQVSSKSRKKGKKGKKDPEPEVPEIVIPDVRVTIEGIALDNKTVADFMTRLEESEFFTDVRLVNLKRETIKQKERADINLKSFQVACKKIVPELKESQQEEKS